MRLFEGLLDLLEVLEQPDVVGEFRGGLGDAGEDVGDTGVHLAGVGLAGDRVAAGEAHLFGDERVELLAFGVVAAEELEEAGLGSGGALGAEEAEGGGDVVEVFEVGQDVLEPEGRALADGGGLGGLEVGEGERGERGVFFGEVRQVRGHGEELAAQERQCLAHDD